MLYEMITGQRPFDGDTPASVMGAILKHMPPALASRQPLTPPTLDDVVQRCLAKDRDDRWQSAADIKSVLELRKRPEGLAPQPNDGAHVLQASVIP